MAKQIVSNLHAKSKRLTIVGTREEFKGNDIVNLREFIDKDDELTATEKGFTIPAEQFHAFFKSLRKFGRAAGLLPEAGEDAKTFELKSLDSVVTDGEDENEDDGEAAAPVSGIKRNKKEKKADKKAKQKEAKEKAAKKSEKKASKSKDDGDFSMKDFKKAIKKAFKHADDMSHAAEVLAMYKSHRKSLKEELPKHAVNACEKALENKKDDSYLAKAIVSLVKHVLGE